MDNNRPVKFGTPIHNQPALCNTCRHATKMRGLADSQRYIICNEVPSKYSPLRIHVVECSSYDDRSKPTLRQFELIAWELATDKSGQKIGFMSPAEFRRAKEKKKVAEEAPMIDPLNDRGW